MRHFHFRLSLLVMPVFAERLKVARQARNFTQVHVANLLGVTPRVYNRWEKGVATPHLETLVALADVLQVSLDELTGRTDDAGERAEPTDKLHRLYRQLDHLADEDRQALLIVMDSLVKRSQMSKVLNS